MVPAKSYLSFTELHEGTSFAPTASVISSDQVRVYRRVLGLVADDRPGLVPAGFAGILARRGYLHGNSMPPGGIMLGQSVRWLRPARVDEPIEVRARVSSRFERKSHRIVVIECELSQDGDPVARIETTVSWP